MAIAIDDEGSAGRTDMTTLSSSGPRRLEQKHLELLGIAIWISLIFFAILIGRASVSQNTNLLDLKSYAQMKERSPFQERILMAPVLRAAEQSTAFGHLYQSGFKNSVRTPDDLAVSLVNCVSLLLLLPTFVSLRKKFSPPPKTTWLMPLICMLILALTYVVRYEQAFSMPYDFPSVLFFTLGLLAIITNRGWLLLLIVFAAIPNRETAVFLLPIWFAVAWERGDRIASCSYLIAGAMIALGWRLEIAHLLNLHKQSYEFPFRNNLMSVVLPLHWAQLFSAFGFLLAPLWILRASIVDRKLKAVLLGTIPFILTALVVGVWRETRIFGELTSIVGIAFAIQLEAVLALRTEGDTAHQTLRLG